MHKALIQSLAPERGGEDRDRNRENQTDNSLLPSVMGEHNEKSLL